MYYDDYMYNEPLSHESDKETQREFTEAQLYRTLSQLYDRVEERKAYKRLKTVAVALTSNGITHLIAALASTFPNLPFIDSKRFTFIYIVVSALMLIAGILLLAIHGAISGKCAPKERLIQEFIDHEFKGERLSNQSFDSFHHLY